MASTPTPPPATYTKLADLTGDRTINTVGIQYASGPGINFTQTQTLASGSGVRLAYTAATDTYVLTAADGTTASFAPSNALPVDPAAPNVQRWDKTAGTTRDLLALIVPKVNNVPLSYVALGSWNHVDTTANNGTVRLAIGGANTVASDMPRSGSANYATAVGGAAQVAGTVVPYSLNTNSTATFSASFASSSVTTSLVLAGVPANAPTGAVTNFGTYNGTGTISGSNFSGTVTGTDASGSLIGGFFGPQALELGYDWFLNGASLNAVGTVTGIKQ